MLRRNAWWIQRNIKIQPLRKVTKGSAIVYAGFECLLEKMHSCQNNPERLYTEKKLSIHLLVIQYLQVVWLNKKQTWLLQR